MIDIRKYRVKDDIITEWDNLGLPDTSAYTGYNPVYVETYNTTKINLSIPKEFKEILDELSVWEEFVIEVIIYNNPMN